MYLRLTERRQIIEKTIDAQIKEKEREKKIKLDRVKDKSKML